MPPGQRNFAPVLLRPEPQSPRRKCRYRLAVRLNHNTVFFMSSSPLKNGLAYFRIFLFNTITSIIGTRTERSQSTLSKKPGQLIMPRRLI